MIKELINKDRRNFSELMLRHRVAKLYAFGSGLHGPFTSASDIDVFVDVNEPDDLLRGAVLMDLWDGLEGFFGRRVDLLTDNSLNNPAPKAAGPHWISIGRRGFIESLCVAAMERAGAGPHRWKS